MIIADPGTLFFVLGLAIFGLYAVYAISSAIVGWLKARED